ncbi:MAG: hypothetical protein QHC67_03535 [Sphingobium sp.]|uniref:hypothetical protein n=1 Tax=Sphingobium sp. TaxID=1912891 RepID=UPI0029A53C03|nr:hypothetical protein [Sphingobium sp.]MDX3908871.1 hypothetical protein [Sphingobium sp.]
MTTLVTGADIVAAIEQGAKERGVSVHWLARRLSSDPRKWLSQVAIAQRPTPLTIARVEALLADEPLPRAVANNFQLAREERAARHTVAASLPLPDDFQPLDREPCPRCAVRGDIGCSHRGAVRP